MTRRAAIWTAILAVAAAAMAASPLVGLLGFESSFLIGVLQSLASAHLGAEAVWHARRAASPADGDLDEARPGRAVGRLFARAFAGRVAAALVPLAILSANALRVKDCDLPMGLAWFAIFVIVNAATGTAAGLFAGFCTHRRISGTILAISIVVISIIWGVWRIYAAPPVFGYDPFVGWFPGTLYDEALAIEWPLLAARAIHLLGAAWALALAAALLDGRALRLRLRVGSPRALATAIALFAAWAGARAAAAPWIDPDAATIARALGGRRDTAHLTLLYSPSGPWAKDIDLYARDGEFRWAQLARTFGVAPGGKVTAYLFDSAESKRRWMGAAHTQVAKPWRREIYLQYDPWPHPVIKHELAHVFAGAFGDGLFHVSRRGFRINVGLIEGAAVAADARPERVGLDQQVKIMRLDGNQPPLDAVFSLAFLEYPPARAYTVAGSFCRFLLETRGAEKFRALYHGGGDFRAAYGEDLAELAAEWGRRIDAAPLTDEERGIAADRLRRPSIFHKVCAHDLARRQEEARAALGRGDADAAIRLLESIIADEPDEPAHLADLMDTLVEARRGDRALEVARRLLAHPKASDAQKARALSLVGDDQLRRRDPAAAATFAAVLALPLDEGTARVARAKRIAATDGQLGPALARYLVGDAPGPREAALDLLRAEEVVKAAPASGLGHYLLGRQLAGHDRCGEARAPLARARALGLPEGGFDVEATRLAAVCAYREGDRAAARALFGELAASKVPSLRAEAEDWIARCDFVSP